jgi:hypothetical protein
MKRTAGTFLKILLRQILATAWTWRVWRFIFWWRIPFLSSLHKITHFYKIEISLKVGIVNLQNVVYLHFNIQRLWWFDQKKWKDTSK